MKRILLLALMAILACAGLGLFLYGLAPFLRDFARLETGTSDLAPRMIRLLAGLGCLGAIRWVWALPR